MKPNIYNILSRCVLDGIEQGVINTNNSGIAGVNAPRVNLSPEMTENIHMSIMREITEYIDFEEPAK